MSNRATHLVWLEEVDRSHSCLVGSKAAHLGDLFRLGLPVPKGICITTAGYDFFLKKSGIFFELREIAAFHTAELASASSAARKLIYEAEIPELLKDRISQACRTLTGGKNHPLAVRSSSVDEDLASDSFAGLYESYLDLYSVESVFQRIRDCWASFWSEKALVYRADRGFANSSISGGVIVQRMVKAEAAGVLFTRNPVENDNLSMVLELVRGTGEQLVSGAVTPDRYVVTRSELQIVSRQIAIRNDQYVASAADRSSSWVSHSARLEIVPDQEILDLCRTGLAIERSFHKPQDIEWAKENGKYYFLQARPITFTQDDVEAPPDPSVWTRENINERFPDPLKPLEASFVNDWVFTPGCAQLFRSLGADDRQAGEVFRTFRSLLYVNKKLFTGALRGLPEEITRQIFDHDNNGNSGMPHVELSWPLLGTMLRLLRVALSNHRRFERKLKTFLANCQRFRNNNYGQMGLEQLGMELRLIGDSIQSISAGHFQSIIIAEILLAALIDFCANKDVLLLVCGLENNKTVEMNKRFSELCSAVAADERIYSILLTTDSEQALSKLKARAGCRHFLWLLNRFLEDFGHRSAKYQLSHPRWKEKPAQVLDLIRISISAPEHSNSGGPGGAPIKQLARAVEQGLLRSVFSKVLPWKKALFRLLLHYARIYCGILRENEGFYITMPFPEVKRALSFIAEEFVNASVLDQPSDIYYLTISEINQLTGNNPIVDLRRTIAVRKQTFFRDSLVDTEVPNVPCTVLSGTAASPGVAFGRARVLTSLSEGFEPGSILVTHSLNAAWVPLLRSASGVVTDVGGILSHAAVLAREFRVPAVLGAKTATTKIQPNQMITIDGTNGKVFLNTA